MSGEARFWRLDLKDIDRQLQTCHNCGEVIYGNRPICLCCNSKIPLNQVPHYKKTLPDPNKKT